MMELSVLQLSLYSIERSRVEDDIVLDDEKVIASCFARKNKREWDTPCWSPHFWVVSPSCFSFPVSPPTKSGIAFEVLKCKL